MLIREDRYILREQRKYLLWIAAGAVVFWVEHLLLCVSSRYELFKETVVLSIVPTALFWAINRFGKETSFSFLKSVVCIWIGRLVFDGMVRYSNGREAVRWMLFWQIMLTILMFCMKIIQMVYDKVPDKKVYFGYVLMGTALAFNVSYIAREYDSFSCSAGSWREAAFEYMYVLEHGIAFFIVAAVVLIQYQKRYKVRIKNSGITGKVYLYHAIKMTIVSFLVFIYPLYILFLSE